MSGKSLLFGLLLFGFGLGLGLMAPRPTAFPDPFLAAKDKLQALASTDLEDYYRLKTMEEKYRKADEILGKIMQIFLADLGLHVSGQAQRAAQTPLPSVTDRASPVAPAAPRPSSPAVVASVSETKKPELPSAADEAVLSNTRDESDIPQLLKKLQIQNFDEARKSTRAFSNRDNVILSINGSFEGRANVTSHGQPHQWDLHVEMAGAMQKEQLRGNLKIRMLENGKVFSNSNNAGSLDSFREFSGDSKALLAEASPTDYFQVYYVKDLDQLAINLYQRASADSGFVYIGSAVLKRTR